MLPIRVLGLVVVVFFAIAIGPALIKVPERTEAIAKISAANVADWSNEDASELETPGANFAIVPAKELESASIPVEQGEVPTASEIAEGPSAKSLPPTSYGALSSEVDAAQVDSYDLTGSVRSGAQAPRKVQKPNPRVRRTAPQKASADPGWWSAYAHKPLELPPPNFTNSGY